MDRYTQLKKALHRAIAKAYKTGNKTVMKALDGMPSKEHTVKHIMADLEDPNDIPQVPHNHLPANSESVLNKDADPSLEHNKNLQNIQGQKEMQAKAQLGQMESTDSSQKIHMNEGQENGVSKLKKFMDTKMAKSSKSFDRAQHKEIKGVHTSGGFSGLEEEGKSQAGNEITSRAPKAGNEIMRDMHHERGKQMHADKLKELKGMPKPNLPKSEMGKSQACGKCEACMKAKQMQKRCWEGYEPVAGKKAYSKGSCKKK